jgi:putative cell wall-binding protein
LLTSGSFVPQATVDSWRALGVRKVVLVGGAAVIADNVESFVRDRGRCAGAPGCELERLAGADRYATSLVVAQRSVALGGRSLAAVLLPTGRAFPDSVVAGILAARRSGVALLVDGSGQKADASVIAFLRAHAPEMVDVAIVGGASAVGSAADRAIEAALDRP